MLKTKKPIKVEKEWIKVLDGEGFVTLDRKTRLYYSYSDKKPTDNFNKVRDVDSIRGYRDSSLWLKASADDFFATANELKIEEKAQTDKDEKKDNKEKKDGTK